MANDSNPHLKDVVKAFNKIDPNGDRDTLNKDPILPNIAESHIQGVCAASGYYLMTCNNKGYSEARLLTVDASEKKLVHIEDAHVEHHNHAGGCQKIGDYMVVGIETSEYDDGGIWLYSLAGDLRKDGPKKLRPLAKRSKKGCGGAGITDFVKDGKKRWLAVAMDSGHLDFYVSNARPLDSSDCSFEHDFEAKLKGDGNDGCSSVNLVTDVSGEIYLFGFVTRGDEDHALLYKVDRGKGSVELVDDRHFYTHHGSVVGPYGVHFRWGAGLKIKDDSRLEIMATQRNFVANMCAINTFEPS